MKPFHSYLGTMAQNVVRQIDYVLLYSSLTPARLPRFFEKADITNHFKLLRI